ncbi:MAG: hypothetical protein OXQ92_16870 [Boseongicola sp.]|nr:hypothetical protein [Boseongicola sp.]MDD9978080.1 hypothetical protein [Boseongicola sp.]
MVFRFTTSVAVIAVLSGCASSIPDSNPETGVGFGNYDQYLAERARRNAELQAMRGSPVPEGQVIAQDTLNVLNVDRPVNATPTQTAVSEPQTVEVATVDTGNPDISDEQEFDAVSTRESIESDAERLERNREQYQIVQPTALPERAGDTGPNIVAFALSTNHPRGTQMFERSGRSNVERFTRVCASYGTDDQAQQAFLANGGPQRDRKGLDPDGDGYACFWDPSPFRSARGG